MRGYITLLLLLVVVCVLVSAGRKGRGGKGRQVARGGGKQGGRKAGGGKAKAGKRDECGTAPDFRPCVNMKKANRRMLKCCRRVNMPAACLHLCKYDVTEEEASLAANNKLCGIQHLRRYLMCAADLNDNTNCCVAKKKDPFLVRGTEHCIEYCNPIEMEIPTKDKSRLVCGYGLHRLMQCHHAGLRW